MTELQKEQEKCNKKLNEAKDKIEYDRVLSKLHSLSQDIKRIESLINLPCGIEISEREKQLMLGAVLTVQGRAGTGKTQLLAYKTKQLLSSGRNALLLNAGDYYSTNPIREQIIKNLGFDYSFDELIDVLETIGENGNYIVPLFIDAINETWNRNLWKTELPRIIEKVKRCQMVKLVLSYRTEYEEILLSNAILEMKRKGDVLNMTHRGFEDNSTEAIKEFLNRYGIPFSPLEYFSYEMSNPLFLKLYCETYDGTEVSLPDLYERLISKANTNIHRSLDKEFKTKGYDENEDILMPLVLDIAKYLALKGKRTIAQTELDKLEFWSHYELVPAVIVKQLIHERILHETLYENENHLYFAYDQMNDYYCAKAIVEEFEEEALRHYLSENILGIKEGQLTKEYNIDLFVNACALYAEKYGSECINIIAELSDDFDKQTVFSRYIDSFQWRNLNHFSANGITELLKQYPCEPESLWKMLIGNSVKVHHPYNADFLHTFLSSYSLNKRDYLWTTYINQLTCVSVGRSEPFRVGTKEPI